MNDTIEITKVPEADTVEITQVPEAMELIDRGLIRLQKREIVPADEVTDLLLDVRSLLALIPEEPVSN